MRRESIFSRRILTTAALSGLAIMMFGGSKPVRSQMALEGTRYPAYAGSWYEADGSKLKAQLQTFLNKATPAVAERSSAILSGGNAPVTRPVLAVVVPHAGYVYSGQAAAYAYKSVQGQPVKRIFLLGPSHHVALRGAALPMSVTFATPLGDLEVDRETVELLKSYPMFTKSNEVHKVEHSLEMQLPYIKEVFPEAKIVPIVVGQLSDDIEVRLLAEILKGYVAQGDLIVVSSDFTHFGPRYDYQPFKENVREGIRKLDSRAYKHLSRLDLDGFLKFEHDTKDTICGFYPCAVLMAMLPDKTAATLLDYYTSQDVVTEEKENSVSYMAVAFSGKSWPAHPEKASQVQETIQLTPQDKTALLKLARGTVEAYVRNKEVPTPDKLGVQITEPMKQMLGVFVTLRKRVGTTGSAAAQAGAHRGYDLRGCIGYIWPQKPLYQAVIDNAVSACSRDYRFYSVQPDELKDLVLEISALTPPRRVSSYKDIVIGRDGMVLFKDGRQAVFLPTVAPEFGWDLSETLSQLAQKAGLKADAWKEGAQFDTFQSVAFEEDHPKSAKQ